MNETESYKREAIDWLAENRSVFTDLSDEVWGYAEPAHREYKSSAAHERVLADHGFSVEHGVAGMPTAFVATAGTESPVIGFFAEYDATPGNSQKPVPHEEPVKEGAAGFEDCHNALGAGGTAAACATKEMLDRHDIEGTVTLYGTPAEKLCTAKTYLAREGYYDDLDAMIGWHPRSYTTVLQEPGPGPYRLFIVDFDGEAGYGGKPWSGTSGLDATTLMQVMLNFMKQRIPRSGHPSITEVVSDGGRTPTNFPGTSQLWLATRASDLETLDIIEDIVRRSAEAAGMVTGVDANIRKVSSTRPWLPNHTMMDIAYENLQLVGPPSFTEADQEFGKALLENYGVEDPERPFDETLSPPDPSVTSGFLGGADDITEFSWHAPTCRINVAYQPEVNEGYDLPSWLSASLAKTNVAHESFMTAAKAMAATALDLYRDQDILESAEAEFRERLEEDHLTILVSEDAEPPIEDTIPPFYPENWQPPTDLA